MEQGERVLARATGPDGLVVATTHRLRLPGPPGEAVEWSRIDNATWNGDDQVLMVTEVPGPTGRRPRHRIAIHEPGRLVDVVREQVTASVLISRRIAVDGPRSIRVTGRRTADGGIVWSAELDPGIDMDDQATRQRVDDAVALVRGEVE